MNFSQSVISLEFNKEDSDLWGALQLIVPEKRSTFIKEALRRTLVAGLSPECFYSEGASSFMDKLNVTSIPMIKSAEEDLIQGNFDELAIQENSSREETRVVNDQSNSLNESNDLSYYFEADEKASNPSEMQSNSNQVPWEHLLYNIIGVEEDEAIINVLNNATIRHNIRDKASLSIEDISSEDCNPSSKMQDINLEDLKVNSEIAQSIGIEYSLKQVTGEETDAEIIEFLQSRESKKP